MNSPKPTHWTFTPLATVSLQEDGTYRIYLDWEDSYDQAWEEHWNPTDDPVETGAQVLDAFLAEHPQFTGRLAMSHDCSEHYKQKLLDLLRD